MTVDFDKLRDIFHVAVEQYAPEQWDAYLDTVISGNRASTSNDDIFT